MSRFPREGVGMRTSSRRGRAFGITASALGFAAYLMLTAVPAQAATEGLATCTYDAVDRQVTVRSPAGSNVSVRVGAGGAIVFDDDLTASDGVACDVASVANTDGITAEPGNNFAIDLGGGPFAPGETPEASGTSEIEIDVDGSVNDLNDLGIEGSGGDDTITVGNGLNAPSGGQLAAGAISLNTDGDADVTFNDNEDGDGDLLVEGNNGNDSISFAGGSGTGAFLEQSGPAAFGGNNAADSGTNADDGNDTLTGSDFVTSDGDRLFGDEGNDTLTGGAGEDDLSDAGDVDTGLTCATDENDVLIGGAGSDDLNGGDGNDLLDGGNDDDFENGSDCDDTFDQGSGPNGDDTIDGGSPISAAGCFGTRADLVDYGDRNSDLVVDLTGGPSGEVGAAEADTLTDIESAIGGSGDDDITGSGLENFLAGGDGDDTFNAFSSFDCIQPGAGNDTVDGAANTDMVDYSDAPNGVVVDLAAGTATGHG